MTKAFLPYLFILPSLAYSLMTLSAVCAFFKREQRSGKISPPVSIIKPIKGLDAGSRQNLESFCLQDYPEFQIIFALHSPEDPCLPVIRQLIAAYPERDMDVVIDGTSHGANAKVSNLINAFPLARHDTIVIADSDISVAPDYLEKVTAHFSDPKTGLVTSLYRGANVHGAASAIEALGFSAEMVPNVIVAERLEGLSFALGASMAVRRKALESIGGFISLADYLADDYQLGNMIHRAGWRIVLSGDFVESVMQRESLADVLARQLRWCRTMRVSRPSGYLASGITHPFPALLLSIAVAGFLPTFSAAALLYLVRGSMLTFFSRSFIKDNLLPRYLWLLPIRDALSTATWALAFLGNRVRWRGEIYTLKTDGKMARRG
jgi:ceramide glucosyltransferase